MELMTDKEIYKQIYDDNSNISTKIRRADKAILALDKLRIRISRSRNIADKTTIWGQATIAAFDTCLMLINEELDGLK